jgi:hypothetical protein
MEVKKPHPARRERCMSMRFKPGSPSPRTLSTPSCQIGMNRAVGRAYIRKTVPNAMSCQKNQKAAGPKKQEARSAVTPKSKAIITSYELLVSRTGHGPVTAPGSVCLAALATLCSKQALLLLLPDRELPARGKRLSALSAVTQHAVSAWLQDARRPSKTPGSGSCSAFGSRTPPIAHLKTRAASPRYPVVA